MIPVASTFPCSVSTIPTPRFGQKRILISSDIDDTFISWTDFQKGYDEVTLQRTLHTVSSAAVQKNSRFMLNTGRNLTSVQRLANHFQSLPPIDYLGLNDGQELYINQKHVPTAEWIAQLTPDKQNGAYRRFLQRTYGWNKSAVTQAIESMTAPYIHPPSTSPVTVKSPHPVYKIQTKGSQPLYLMCPIKGASFLLSSGTEQVTDEVSQLGNQLARNILHILKDKKQNVTLDIRQYKQIINDQPAIFVHYAFKPKDISKATLLQHVVSKLPGLSAVITAGDEMNDLEMLTQHHYTSKHKTPIPNYPILSGDHNVLQGYLANNPRFHQVPAGDIGPGILMQLKRIVTHHIARLKHLS